MQISRKRMLDIISRLTHFKYHETCLNIDEVISASVSGLEWVISGNGKCPVKSEKMDLIRSDFLYDYGAETESSRQKAVENAAKAVFDEVFYNFKIKAIGWELVKTVTQYMNVLIVGKRGSTDSMNSEILNAVMEDFVKYYDPSQKSWKTFASTRFKHTYNNIIKKYSDTDTISPIPDDDDGDENPKPHTGNIKDNSLFGDSEENIRKIDTADFMRDIMKHADKYTKPAVYKQFRCFFTFHIAEWMELNESIWRHVKRHRNSFDAVIDINFLNHYVDYNCNSIVDAYGKARKPLSHFGCKGDSTPCNTLNKKGDPPQVIYTSYLGKSNSSISQNYQQYKELLHCAMSGGNNY